MADSCEAIPSSMRSSSSGCTKDAGLNRDANSGDLLLGWDTDQFNTDVKELTLAMVSILKAGGLRAGRGST